MDNYYLMYNPTSGSFYAYGGRNFKWDGSSKPYVEKALAEIEQLRKKEAVLDELLKQVKLDGIDPELVKQIMEL